MSAELFLHSRMERARTLYGQLFEVIDQMHDLSHLDVLPQIREQAETLFTSLQEWYAHHPSGQDLTLFDTVSQLRDLARGDSTVWLQSLTVDLVADLRSYQNHFPHQVAPLLDLASHVYDLAHHRTQEQIPEVLWSLHERISQSDEPSDSISTGIPGRDSREQVDALLRGTQASPGFVVEETSVKDILVQIDAIQMGEKMDSLRALAREWLHVAKDQQVCVLPLDEKLVALARQLDQQVALSESHALLEALGRWQMATQDSYDTLLLIGEHSTSSEEGAPAVPLKEAVTTWSTQSLEGAASIHASLLAVKQCLQGRDEDRIVLGMKLWTDLAVQLIARWSLVQTQEEILSALASLYDDLATGSGSVFLKLLADRLVEVFRPPLVSPLESTAHASANEPEDDRPTAQAWKQIALLAHEEAKRRQEQRADDLDAPGFHLAVQLRDVMDGNSNSRLRVLSSRLVDQLSQPHAFLEEAAHTSLLTRAMEIADLAREDPLTRLRTLSATIVEQLSSMVDAQPVQETNLTAPSDLLSLFVQATKVHRLAQEQVTEPLCLFWERVESLINGWEADGAVEDPELVALICQLPHRLAPLDYESLQQGLHEVLHALRSRLHPVDGYFRDSYNGTNILLMLGMDWWRDVLPRVERESLVLPLASVHWLYQQVCETELQRPTEHHWLVLQQQGIPVEEEGEHSRDAWCERFRHQKAHLQALLKQAIDLEEPLICDL